MDLQVDLNSQARARFPDGPVVPTNGDLRELGGSRKETAKLAARLLADALASGLRPSAEQMSEALMSVALPDEVEERLRSVAVEACVTVAQASLSLLRQQLVIHRRGLAREAEQEQARLEQERLDQAAFDEQVALLAPTLKAPRVVLRERDGRIELAFPFHEEAVAIVRDLPGAKFHRPGDDDRSKFWSVSARYRKRVEMAAEAIDRCLAHEAARAAILGEKEFDHKPKEVRVVVQWPEILVSFDFNETRRGVMNSLRARGSAWWNGKAWVVPWSRRDELRAVIDTL